MKRCPACRRTLRKRFFNKCSKNWAGISAYCKKCNTKHMKKYYQKKKLHLKKQQVFRAYGLTWLDYQDMLAAQNYACKLCETPEKQLMRKLAIDHCHTTGKIRGLLCGTCNRGLGMLKDSATILKKAILYLENFEK